jgi:hypothetical protein
MKHEKTLSIAAAVVLLLATSVSAAPTYTFQNITNNNATNAATGESQLSVELVDLGGNSVEFLFLNSGPLASSITDIYFDNGNLGTLSGPIGFTDALGTVSFAAGAAPGNLPGGNDVDFDTTSGLSVDSDAPVQPNGINPGEQLGLTLSGDYTDVVNQIAAGNLRIGIHVQGFANGGSESFVNNPPTTSVVPAPGSILLSGIGISIVGLLRNRKNAALH